MLWNEEKAASSAENPRRDNLLERSDEWCDTDDDALHGPTFSQDAEIVPNSLYPGVSARSTGKVSVNVVPSPTVLSTERCPPCRSTMR